MKHSIALRLLAFFSAALLLFALVSGLLFSSLFKRWVIEQKRGEMLRRAESLAQGLTDVLTNPQGGMGMGPGGASGGYGSYVRLLGQYEPDVWILDENLNFLTSGRMMYSQLEYRQLPPEADELVQAVYGGHSPFSEGFSDLLGSPTLTVGSPIYKGDTVAGALLLHDAVAGMDAAAAQGQRILLYSGGAALLLAILLSVLLSLTFTKPISRMKTTAGLLAGGDYAARTGIGRTDEIGQLAASIDTLSLRLAEARAQAEREEQQRKDFLANVSHELRTPVTVLRASLEALQDGVVSDPEKVRDYHSQMLRETQGLQRLVNDLMELARLQSSEFPIERDELSLNEVMQDVLRSAEGLARGRGIAIERALWGEPVAFLGDYARLKQMLLIVLDNAVKFSPENGRIAASLAPKEIRISDQGPGIPAEDLPQIFDRFHKSRGGDKSQGSGLGLTIARQIALRHGMDIYIESAVGKGTVVRFNW